MKKKYTKDYSIIDNAVLQCNQLSIEARGAYAYCFSLPDDWEFSIFRVAKAFKCGVEKATRIINELIEFGLLEKEVWHTDKGYKKVSYTLYDMGTRIVKACSDEPYKENPYAENPYKENPDNNKIINNTKKESHKEIILQNPPTPQRESESVKAHTSKASEYSEEFEKFWGEYPRKLNKKLAFKAWNNCLKAKVNADMLIAKAKEYADSVKAKGTQEQYIKHAQSWLNGACYENDYTAELTQQDKQRQAVMQRGLSDWGSNDDDGEFF